MPPPPMDPTWRIIPVGKWLITMVIVSPPSRIVPFIDGRTPWLIHGGDPNYLLTGMTLQVCHLNALLPQPPGACATSTAERRPPFPPPFPSLLATGGVVGGVGASPVKRVEGSLCQTASLIWVSTKEELFAIS